MVYRKRQLKEFLDKYYQVLKQRIDVDQLILFGSYAYGNPKEWSDIDIAVISRGFSGLNDFERIKFLMDLSYNIDLPYPTDVEIVGFTPAEFENPPRFSLVEEIKERGKVFFLKKNI